MANDRAKPVEVPHFPSIKHTITMVSLTRVDKLEYLVLVDNSEILTATELTRPGIERLSKLPPGFSHELPAHLAHAQTDDVTGLPVTAFEAFCCGAHGLSILIV